MKLEELVQKVTQACVEIYNTLGSGFVENVYSGALEVELRSMGVKHVRDKAVEIFYKEEKVGEGRPDFFVRCEDGELVVELKTGACLQEKDELQLETYLKSTGVRHGLLVNFPVPPRKSPDVLLAKWDGIIQNPPAWDVLLGRRRKKE